MVFCVGTHKDCAVVDQLQKRFPGLSSRLGVLFFALVIFCQNDHMTRKSGTTPLVFSMMTSENPWTKVPESLQQERKEGCNNNREVTFHCLCHCPFIGLTVHSLAWSVGFSTSSLHLSVIFRSLSSVANQEPGFHPIGQRGQLRQSCNNFKVLHIPHLLCTLNRRQAWNPKILDCPGIQWYS